MKNKIKYNFRLKPPYPVTSPFENRFESALFKIKLSFMNAFEYRPKLGLF